MIVYLVRDIPWFVMYCVYEESGSSLLIESVDKRVFQVVVNMYVPIFRGLDARGGRKLRIDTHMRYNHSNDNNKYYSKR